MANKNGSEPVIGLDLGGTKILAGVVDRDGQILGSAKRATKPASGTEKVVDRMVRVAREAAESAGIEMSKIAGLGAGTPGPVDPDTGIVHVAPNLSGWVNVPLVKMLSDRLEMPTFIENDVNLGTLGEYALGAGQGCHDVVGIFIGTGIGGGLILDGKLRQGWRKGAGEIGHMIMLPDGPLCSCGNRGCLESLASRTAIDRDIRAGIGAGRDSIVPSLLEREGRDRLTSSVLAEALKLEDPLVSEAVGRAQHYLGLMIASVANLLDPERIILGGGVVEALGEEFLEPIRAVAYQNFINKREAHSVKIVPAKLGDSAGLLGAAVYVHSRLNGNLAADVS